MLLAPPHMLQLPSANVTATVVNDQADVLVTSSQVALLVTLSTLAPGRFSENAFMLLPNVPRKVFFIPWAPLDLAFFQSSLKVQHLQQACIWIEHVKDLPLGTGEE
mmetsp:Transcript_28454/g.65564  ORF Transcript_28454/g.65564 Transcript_28454/m.65564 type:complete len:106 (+) Transcript_28454:1261-1578(+)